MRESLRGRLVLGHTVTVATVVVAFAASMAYMSWRTRLADIDARLEARAESLARSVQPADGGRFDLTLGPGLRYDDAPDLYHALWAPDGSAVDRSDEALTIGWPGPTGVDTRDGRRELATEAVTGVRVLVGRDLADVRRDVWVLATTLTTVGTAILLASVLVGWWLVGRALRPLDQINRTARTMTGGDLSARIQVDAVDSEVSQLARGLNSAFDELQRAIDRERRFTADASHELRTPLTTLSTEVQWALAHRRSEAELRGSLEVASRATARMQSVIERLLQLARSGASPSRHVPVDLAGITTSVVDELAPLAARAGVTMTTNLSPVVLAGDAYQLHDAISNVLTNAIRYNATGGKVDISLKTDADGARLTIADTGMGIPERDLPFVFEPFYRGDPARSRDTGGAGLGLAVARAHIEAHGGTIAADSSPTTGTRITMRWPLARLTLDPPNRA